MSVRRDLAAGDLPDSGVDGVVEGLGLVGAGHFGCMVSVFGPGAGLVRAGFGVQAGVGLYGLCGWVVYRVFEGLVSAGEG